MKTLIVMLLVVACGKKPTTADDKPAGSDQKPASDAASAPPAITPWKLDSQPIELSCGGKPLAIPAAATPATPPSDRALPRAPAFAVCQDLPSIDDVCKCLATSIDKWTKALSSPASCALTKQGNPHAHLVELHSTPDPDLVGAGTVFVLVAAHGTKWSAVDDVESAPDVDFGTTPKASHGAKITMFEARQRADATLLWIQSQNQYSESGMGEQDANGAAVATICIAPTTAAPYCYAPIALADWDYTFTIAKADQPDACEIRDADAFSASVDSGGVVTVHLDRGVDKSGASGPYHL